MAPQYIKTNQDPISLADYEWDEEPLECPREVFVLRFETRTYWTDVLSFPINLEGLRKLDNLATIFAQMRDHVRSILEIGPSIVYNGVEESNITVRNELP